MSRKPAKKTENPAAPAETPEVTAPEVKTETPEAAAPVTQPIEAEKPAETPEVAAPEVKTETPEVAAPEASPSELPENKTYRVKNDFYRNSRLYSAKGPRSTVDLEADEAEEFIELGLVHANV